MSENVLMNREGDLELCWGQVSFEEAVTNPSDNVRRQLGPQAWSSGRVKVRDMNARFTPHRMDGF